MKGIIRRGVVRRISPPHHIDFPAQVVHCRFPAGDDISFPRRAGGKRRRNRSMVWVSSRCRVLDFYLLFRGSVHAIRAGCHIVEGVGQHGRSSSSLLLSNRMGNRPPGVCPPSRSTGAAVHHVVVNIQEHHARQANRHNKAGALNDPQHRNDFQFAAQCLYHSVDVGDEQGLSAAVFAGSRYPAQAAGGKPDPPCSTSENASTGVRLLELRIRTASTGSCSRWSNSWILLAGAFLSLGEDCVAVRNILSGDPVGLHAPTARDINTHSIVFTALGGEIGPPY